ncbi:MAG TPA: hypothetical protein VJQ82_25840 [Terriglobales bacterium]|nr:hypothetical protein [Terriglobales bacterium]
MAVWIVRRMFLVTLALGLLSISALGQRVELYGGAQYMHLEPAFNGAGWEGALTGNFKHVLGVTADFSGTYGRHNLQAYTYMAGPVLTARLPVVQPFVHALFGGLTVKDGASDTNFAFMLGGGLDLGFRRGIGFRLIQVDWLSAHFNGDTFNKNVRASAGIVIKF